MSNDIQIYNMDCFELISKLKSEGTKVNAILTDPPFGILRNHIIESGVDWNKFTKESYDLLDNNGFLLFFQIWKTACKSRWFEFTMNNGFEPTEDLIWDKLQASNFMNSLPRRHESMFLFSKGDAKVNKVVYDKLELEFENEGAKGKWLDSLKANLNFAKNIFKDRETYNKYGDLHFDNKVDYATKHPNLNDDYNPLNNIKIMQRSLQLAKQVFKGGIVHTVIDMRTHNHLKLNKDEFNIKHPTVKPIQLMEILIQLTTKEGDLVCDPFLGSGTTAIACKNTNRRFVGCEINEDYYKICQDRLK